ncbi:MAG: C26 family cysteine hydrolase domain-containing family [Firmicutes bacterium]|nr:C26 family cysteine hydrolase domain-containing family [Bacillota bacterium]
MRPLVAVTSSALTSSPQVPNRISCYVDSVYTDALVSCGLQPVILPATSPCSPDNSEDPVRLMCAFSGLLVTGGPTLPSTTPLDSPILPLREQDPARWEHDTTVIRAALASGIPVLAVCRGMQVLNEVLGGTTHLNLVLDGVTSLDHNQGTLPESAPYHRVNVVGSSLLARLTGTSTLEVNSFHRQGVKAPGKSLTVSAVSADGVVEAIEMEAGFCLGVQFHAERMPGSAPMRAIMAGFASACRARRKALSREGCRS